MKGGRITIEEKSTLSIYVGVGVAVVLTAGAIYFFVLCRKRNSDTIGFDPNRPIPSDAVMKSRLKAEEYNVVRRGGSETPFQNAYWNNERVGIYVDVIDGQPLFTSLDKYDSGRGLASRPSANRSPTISSSRNPTTPRVCSGSRCGRNGATPTWAIFSPIRNRLPAGVTAFRPPPSISSRKRR